MGLKSPINFSFKVKIDGTKKTAVIDGTYNGQKFRYGIKLHKDGFSCKQFTKENPDDFHFLSEKHRKVLWSFPLDDMLIDYFNQPNPELEDGTDGCIIHQDVDNSTGAQMAYDIISSGTNEFALSVYADKARPMMTLVIRGVLNHPDFHQDFINLNEKLMEVERKFSGKTISPESINELGEDVRWVIMWMVGLGYEVDVRPTAPEMEVSNGDNQG